MTYGGSLTQILWYQMMLLESHLGKILQNSPNGRVWGFWILTAVSNINREGSKIPVNICWCRCVYEFILGLFRFSQLLRCFRFLCMYLVLVSVFFLPSEVNKKRHENYASGVNFLPYDSIAAFWWTTKKQRDSKSKVQKGKKQPETGLFGIYRKVNSTLGQQKGARIIQQIRAGLCSEKQLLR